ncbi:putative atp-dependent dna helicase mph1 [Phaeomoniella chlamydospora]|uniref:ATP-dependent DNA helicase n=1 Tax=Phaeomoniella chlamydospora TaxID=158046 RepID=A0A0G2EQ91_PHACM|nr:putative atp-dependent dna helicase mph1 [Phaeomoniella chlamydospora]
MGSSDNAKSSKRRKLNGRVLDDEAESVDAEAPSSNRSGRSSIFTQEDGSDDSGSEPELPPLRKPDDEPEFEETPPRHNSRIHIPTRMVDHENTYVTQLTQPVSSPSRIRGPRWKRKASPVEALNSESDLEPPKMQTNVPEKILPVINSINDTDTDIDAILRENPEFFADDVDDTLDDVTLLSATENIPSGPSKSRGPRKNLRQQTLFGITSSSSHPSATQGKIHNWPLSSKVETPTHHKLDSDALNTWVYPTNLGSVRDYQFNITQRGLYHNTLVALPTGLGKTFIAATIMLNWYRWTKDAQIVFVAPTKPLVAQQVEACFNVVGIPRSDTTMLTGHIQPALRAQEWLTKRVFFMTPQTLQHDLASGICDPKKIVLLVVDEAHRATGNYAYVEVVRFLRRFNTSFRVLALTATPGSSVESVQDVIDGLDISRVEIRTEDSLDIRQYVHRRNIELEVFDYSEEVTMIMELFSKSLQPILNKLNSQNAYWSKDPMALTAFGLTKARQQWMSSEVGRRAPHGLKGMVNTIFSLLASLAHAVDLLKFHGIGPFFRKMVDFRSETFENNKSGKYAKEVANNEHFKKMMNRLQAWINNDDFVGHPKLFFLKTIVLNHFLDAGDGTGAAAGRPPSDTRIMIFVHFRDSAEEVTRILKRHQPMVRPHVFVGQAGSKGSEGMDQKTQLDIIEKFKSGIYNTIVATSIGEEGLDIGEVDLIVCYDSSSSPIRMLQRMGRTGRKRAGQIHLLLMRGKEEDSYMKAKDNYEKMQTMIADGSRFVFHDDRSPRIVPKDVQPVVDKRVIEIPIENTQSVLPEPKKGRRQPKKPAKKFFMPDGVEEGFVKASVLGSTTRGQQDGELHGLQIRRAEIIKIAPLPPLDEVLLSASQEAELDENYCSISGDSPQFVHVPDLGAFPTWQRTLRRTDTVPHSRSAVNLTRALSTKSPLADRSRPQNPLQLSSSWTKDPTTLLNTARSTPPVARSPPLIGLSQVSSAGSSQSSVVSRSGLAVITESHLSLSPDGSPDGLDGDDDSDDSLPNPSQLLKTGDSEKEISHTALPKRTVQSENHRRRRRLVLDDDEEDM